MQAWRVFFRCGRCGCQSARYRDDYHRRLRKYGTVLCLPCGAWAQARAQARAQLRIGQAAGAWPLAAAPRPAAG